MFWTDLETRINDRGYWIYKDPSSGRWIETHRRAAEKKYGELPPGAHVHHRNGNKLDNRWCNLALVTPRMHARQHHEPGACDRCGHLGHRRAECYARRDYQGNRLPPPRRRRR